MEQETDAGVYCSTAGTVFQERGALQEHYQSEFHRYNLKRKIAGLPPVTREWYDARKAQLAATTAGAVQRVWFDPLTRKKFYSENTYLVLVRSKKYQDLVKRSGKAAPAAVVTLRRVAPVPATATAHAPPAAPGYIVVPAAHGGPIAQRTARGAASEGGAAVGAEDEGSEWETASEEEMGGADEEESWEEWDVQRSLFDNHVSPSVDANLEYMWRKFGFYLPDAEFLKDPEGMLKYLGAKLQYGHVPLYESGDNPAAKQFSSLHAVQRHMVDSGRCKALYEGNEDEYEDFYDYGEGAAAGGDEGGADGMEVDSGGRGGTSNILAVGNDDALAAASNGYELALPSAGDGVRLLGSREFAKYYRQRHRAGDLRASAAAAAVVAQYRRLAVPLLGDGSVEGSVEMKKARKAEQRADKLRLHVSVRRNINDNLPKNVPY